MVLAKSLKWMLATEIQFNTDDATFCEHLHYSPPDSTTNPPVEYMGCKCACDTAAFQNLDSKDKRTMTFASSGLSPEAVVPDVTQSNSSSAPYYQRGMFTFTEKIADQKFKPVVIEKAI